MKKAVRGRSGPSSGLGGFVDGLFATFEDRRPGLSDGAVREGEASVERYFRDVYGPEADRLEGLLREQQPHLSDAARAALRSEVDAMIEKVLIPAYARLAARFTPRERNDFHLLRDPLHLLERVAGALAGVVLGTLVILAPFIPLWQKEWIIPFMLAGLFLPDIRRYLAYSRYERELNHLVASAERELGRIDVAYLVRGEAIAELRDLRVEKKD